MSAPRRRVPPHQAFERQEATHAKAYLLHEGWACSYKLLIDGQRQIINFHLPGDFVGLTRLFAPRVGVSFEAVTSCLVSDIAPRDATCLLTGSPGLTSAILHAAAREEALIAEHLIDVGRRSCEARVAHLLLELGERLAVVGQAESDGYACPLSQHLLADALGLTAIHLNRVLRRLREAGLVTFRGGRVTFHDLPRLVDCAGYEEACLRLGIGRAA